jgi:hypothetical protein
MMKVFSLSLLVLLTPKRKENPKSFYTLMKLGFFASK